MIGCGGKVNRSNIFIDLKNGDCITVLISYPYKIVADDSLIF